VEFFGSDEAESRRLQYPDDLLIEKPYRERKGWYFIFVHIILICYALLGLNTVCDIYFCGALDIMVEKWQIQPDVAGATFMAAGGSAPELFTSLIGATITENDVGFGTIVGSAVFNVLFVIGACGYVAPSPIPLSWWPLFRDCSFYIIGLCHLALFAKSEGSIRLWEAVVLFTMYIIYCTIMYFNVKIEAKFRRLLGLDPNVAQVAPEEGEGKEAEEGAELRAAGAKEEPTPVASFDKKVEDSNGNETNNAEEPPETKIEVPETAQPSKKSDDEKDGEKGEGEGGEGEEGEEEDGDDIEEMMTRPEGTTDRVIWYLSLPIYFSLYWGVPKPTEKMFLATFTASLLWIAGFSFFLVWWVEILGELLHIEYIIMAFTLLAAGTSIPYLVSSMAVARQGLGDMAISSSIGSNIFDILVGLPVPWMLKIALVEGCIEGDWNFRIRIESPYIVFYVLLLLFMVAMIVFFIQMLGWQLNKILGGFMGVLYAIFLACALYAEKEQPEFLKL
jgi:sodium/potassium/calcium exchanger 2